MNYHNPHYEDYKKVIDIFGKEKVDERCNSLYDLFTNYKNSANISSKQVVLNTRILVVAVLDYFSDISRIKTFHHIDNVNDDKIIAYTCYWLLRRKPIQILAEDKENLLYINEKFVLYVMYEHMTKDIDNKSEEQTNNQTDGLKNFLNHLLYHLKYRDVTPKTLELLIVSFRTGLCIGSDQKKASSK